MTLIGVVGFITSVRDLVVYWNYSWPRMGSLFAKMSCEKGLVFQTTISGPIIMGQIRFQPMLNL